eukprot:CAMPEP_0171063600 /NCGR_PEP_ID=MMETSP0766_2-20121228/5769_1 /TAXON_ID=439317 /ORGANISM="Gambierdiscus australes, Strain CAWD 149" /LENGTH=440 /DNA_ID=CAMNT_0011519535 /DNA_START=49 /DNA_END=1367 /DNA_ORIENTATION=+
MRLWQRPGSMPASRYLLLEDPTEAPREQLTGAELRANFWWMSLWFAVAHGCVTAPLILATTVLRVDVASLGNGVLYTMTILASLFVAAPMVDTLGPKASLLNSVLLYCVYAGGFATALFFKDLQSVTWMAFVAGSVCGGLAAGVLWTAQGSYFAISSSLLATAEGTTREAATSSLAGMFASMFLTFEVGSKLFYSGMQQLNVEAWAISLAYVALGLLSWAMMSSVRSLSSKRMVVDPFAKVWAVTSLWSDPTIWLLAPTNLAFGFSAAFMNGFVNSRFTSAELGPSAVGVLAATTAATAALLARPFATLSRLRGKGPVVTFGAACFLGVPLCLFLSGCCRGWGWWLMSLYILQGMGRAVYESTNRAVFSDFFADTEVEAAFANCMLQASLSFAVSFFLQTSLAGPTLAAAVFVLALLAPLGYAAARALQRRRKQRAAQDA